MHSANRALRSRTNGGLVRHGFQRRCEGVWIDMASSCMIVIRASADKLHKPVALFTLVDVKRFSTGRPGVN